MNMRPGDAVDPDDCHWESWLVAVPVESSGLNRARYQKVSRLTAHPYGPIFIEYELSLEPLGVLSAIKHAAKGQAYLGALEAACAPARKCEIGDGGQPCDSALPAPFSVVIDDASFGREQWKEISFGECALLLGPSDTAAPASPISTYARVLFADLEERAGDIFLRHPAVFIDSAASRLRIVSCVPPRRRPSARAVRTIRSCVTSRAQRPSLGDRGTSPRNTFTSPGAGSCRPPSRSRRRSHRPLFAHSPAYLSCSARTRAASAAGCTRRSRIS